MKKLLLGTVLSIIITTSAYCQDEASKVKVLFNIADSLNVGRLDTMIVKGVCREIVGFLSDNKYVFAPDKKSFRQLLDIEDKNEWYADVVPGKHNPVMGGIYNLFYELTSEGNCVFSISHTALNTDAVRFDSYSHSINYLSKENGQKLVAYELIEKCFSLSGLDKESLEAVLKTLKEDEAKYSEKLKSDRFAEESKYNSLAFLPPVNQFRSNTSKGTANGIALVAGYGISIGGFIMSTTSYSDNKRKYNNVSVDLTEAEKEREHYKKQMDACRAGQIASGILFIGTYIYGVANALANRDVYQKNTSLTIAPVAYDKGAGIGFVYRF